MGSVGPSTRPDGFVQPGELARAIDEFNKTLLRVCQESGLECYDAASALPHSPEAFYDDYHMNERAELFADFLANQLANSITGPS